MSSPTILVVDNESQMRRSLCDSLRRENYETLEARCAADAEALFSSSRPDAAIVDYQLPDGDAFQLISKMKRFGGDIPVVVLSGSATIDLAVRFMKQGAEYFLQKPLQVNLLLSVLQRTLKAREQNRGHKTVPGERGQAIKQPFVGSSPAIQRLAAEARKIAPSDVPVQIEGETGTGKGVLARWIHANSARAGAPCVDINCAGICRELLESELFGHEKGAFTGATNAKPGLLETADGGTVFLDEIGDMDLELQPKLLKVIEEQTFRRLGEVRDRRVNVRVLAASNRPLAQLVEENRFRQDLYFRVSAVPLRVPSLRERREDIPELVAVLLQELCEAMRMARAQVDEAALRRLQAHSWPGNIRELRNVLQRALLLCDDGRLSAHSIVLGSQLESAAICEPLQLLELERRHIERVLKLNAGRVDAAAQALGVPLSTLYQRIKRLHISRPEGVRRAAHKTVA